VWCLCVGVFDGDGDCVGWSLIVESGVGGVVCVFFDALSEFGCCHLTVVMTDLALDDDVLMCLLVLTLVTCCCGMI